MNHCYVPAGEGNAPRLIIIFLGWGVRPEAFARLRKSGYDLLLLADYDSTAAENAERIVGRIEQERGTRYVEVVLIAWSFGVRVAADFLSKTALPVSMRLAVGGSLWHVDDERGIPKKIFDATLGTLSADSIRKFLLRTAGSKRAFEEFFSAEDIDDARLNELREQLQWFGSLPSCGESLACWDRAIICENDRIFPAANLRNAWRDVDVHLIAGGSHLPDFQKILDDFVIDKCKVDSRFTEASDTYSGNAEVQLKVAKRLAGYLLSHISAENISAENKCTAGSALSILEVGCGSGDFTRQYLPELLPEAERVTLSDLHCDARLRQQFAGSNVAFVEADADSVIFTEECLSGEDYDLILSSSMLQWLNSPANFIRRCAGALRPGGLLLLSLYGPATFRELSASLGIGLKYPSLAALTKVGTEAELRLLDMAEQTLTLRFANAAEVMRHLRLTGVNALPVKPSTASLRRLMLDWPSVDNATGEALLTFNPLYFVFQKPQQ